MAACSQGLPAGEGTAEDLTTFPIHTLPPCLPKGSQGSFPPLPDILLHPVSPFHWEVSSSIPSLCLTHTHPPVSLFHSSIPSLCLPHTHPHVSLFHSSIPSLCLPHTHPPVSLFHSNIPSLLSHSHIPLWSSYSPHFAPSDQTFLKSIASLVSLTPVTYSKMLIHNFITHSIHSQTTCTSIDLDVSLAHEAGIAVFVKSLCTSMLTRLPL